LAVSRRVPFFCFAVSSLFLALPCAGAESSGAGGPTWRGAGLIPSWRRSLPESEALRVPTPITRDEEVQRVTLKETIGIALENNPGIAAQRLEPARRSEEHTSELQSRFDLVCRLLLEKKKKKN